MADTVFCGNVTLTADVPRTLSSLIDAGLTSQYDDLAIHASHQKKPTMIHFSEVYLQPASPICILPNLLPPTAASNDTQKTNGTNLTAAQVSANGMAWSGGVLGQMNGADVLCAVGSDVIIQLRVVTI